MWARAWPDADPCSPQRGRGCANLGLCWRYLRLMPTRVAPILADVGPILAYVVPI